MPDLEGSREPQHRDDGEEHGPHEVGGDHHPALAHPVDPRARGQPHEEERGGLGRAEHAHLVRSLVSNGFLRAEEPRRDPRGAREVPYRATGLSWRQPVPGGGAILLETFLQEIEGLPADSLNATRLGLKLNPARREELLERLHAVFQEYADADSDPDGEPISLFFVEHPDATLGKP